METNDKRINFPSGWNQTILGKVSKIYDGTHQTPNYVEHGVPFYSVEHVTANDFSHTKYVSEDVYAREVGRVRIEKGDILMTRIGDVGTARHIDWDVRASFYVSLALIKCENDVNSKFVSYLINSHNFQRELWQKTIHVAFPNKINLRDIGQCRLFMPPLNEQNRIVAVLETWDKTIQHLTEKLKLKKKTRKALMWSLLTAKKRLTGFREDWEEVTLGEVSNFVNGYTFKSSTYSKEGIYKIITISNVQDGFLQISDNTKLIQQLPSNISKAQILSIGDLLISMTGNVGRVCLVDQGNCLLNQRVGKITPKNIHPRLLFAFLSDRKFLHSMIERAQGGAQDNLSTTDIKDYRFRVPKSKAEQAAIANVFVITEEEILQLEKKLSLLVAQKRYLLNNLITGKIRTPENLMTQRT